MSYISPTSDISVGPLQYECLRALWKHGPSTVGEVHEELNGARVKAKQPKIAYTTVLTVLRNMVRREVCSRSESTSKRGGRNHSHVYQAARSQPAFERVMAQQFLDAYFDGEPKRMMAALKAGQ